MVEFTGKRLKLNENDKSVLACFVVYPGIWPYRIYKDSKIFLGKYLDKQAVERSINRLEEKGLIGSDDKKVSRKGKKLLLGGIYYLISDHGMQLDLLFKAILTNYGENILFQLFLYPYLDKSTILAIQDYSLLSRIYSYLYECCLDIENIFFMSGKSTYTTQEIFIWRDVPDSKIEIRRLFNFLRARFKLSWLENSVVTKLDDNRSLWIRQGANYVSIKLKNNNKAVMKIRDRQKEQEYELIVKEYNPDFLSVRMPIMSVKENAAHYLLVNTQQRVPGFIFDLAFKGVPGSTDYEALNHDEKFLYALNKTKRKFDSKYYK